MSKAFTKDDGGVETVLVRPRAPLPPGTPNYVTPRGLSLLRDELESLSRARARLESASDEGSHPPEHAALVARAGELAARIASANVIAPATGPQDTVRFGATVTVGTEDGGTRRVQIVGVDEADAGSGRIAFTAPLARALLGAAIGDAVSVRTPRGTEALTVLSIE